MLKNRFLIVFVSAALLVMAALLIYQTSATAKVIAATSSQSEPNRDCPFSVEDIRSMRAVFVKEIGAWLTVTDRGYTGVEGGALALLHCPAAGE